MLVKQCDRCEENFECLQCTETNICVDCKTYEDICPTCIEEIQERELLKEEEEKEDSLYEDGEYDREYY